MRKLLVLLLVIPFLGIAQTPLNDPHWQLKWEDTFDSLNTDRWQKKDQFDQYGQQAQIFIEENVLVKDGNLEVWTKKETFSCDKWAIEPKYFCVRQHKTGKPYEYTSGYLETKKGLEQQYGYIEARIKVPYCKGLWPAFWTYASTSQSDSEEIDIFEILPGRKEYNNLRHSCNPECNQLFKKNKCGDCHWLTVPHQMEHDSMFMTSNIHRENESLFGTESFDIYPIDNYTEWHKYAVEWSPEKIIFYVDDKIVRVSQNNGLYDINLAHFIKFSVSIDPNNTDENFEGLPVGMLVDYIRVYELKNKNNSDLLIYNNYHFDSYDYNVKNKVQIFNYKLIEGSNINLRATKSIEITGEFEVPLGAELSIDVNSK